MELPKFKTNDELPLIMQAKDVAGYLNISLSCGYYVMSSKGFPVMRIGKRMLVTRENFLKWLENSSNIAI